MFARRTFLVFTVLLAAFALLTLPALVWPRYLDSPLGVVAAVPYLSIYLFHGIGVPGLLQNNGACGWGWCAPTPCGWAFLCLVWLGIAWLIAWGIASVFFSRTKEGVIKKEVEPRIIS
jgi:hypothetical protein